MTIEDIKNPYEPILIVDDYIQFLIEWTSDDYDVQCEFRIYEVTGWFDPREPVDIEIYCEGYIKWDGCSNILFAEGNYLHLCGKGYFDNHCKLMDAIWKTVTPKIIGFNEEVAS